MSIPGDGGMGGYQPTGTSQSAVGNSLSSILANLQVGNPTPQEPPPPPPGPLNAAPPPNLQVGNPTPANPSNNPWGLTAADFPPGSLQLPPGTPGIALPPPSSPITPSYIPPQQTPGNFSNVSAPDWNPAPTIPSAAQQQATAAQDQAAAAALAGQSGLGARSGLSMYAPPNLQVGNPTPVQPYVAPSPIVPQTFAPSTIQATQMDSSQRSPIVPTNLAPSTVQAAGVDMSMPTNPNNNFGTQNGLATLGQEGDLGTGSVSGGAQAAINANNPQFYGENGYTNVNGHETYMPRDQSLSGALGRTEQFAFSSLLPDSVLNKLPNQWYLPVRQGVSALTSLAGIATLGAGGLGAGAAEETAKGVAGAILRHAVETGVQFTTASDAQGIVDQNLPANTPPLVRTLVTNAAAVLAGYAGGLGLNLAESAAPSVAGAVSSGAGKLVDSLTTGALSGERGSIELGPQGEPVPPRPPRDEIVLLSDLPKSVRNELLKTVPNGDTSLTNESYLTQGSTATKSSANLFKDPSGNTVTQIILRPGVAIPDALRGTQWDPSTLPGWSGEPVPPEPPMTDLQQRQAAAAAENAQRTTERVQIIKTLQATTGATPKELRDMGYSASDIKAAGIDTTPEAPVAKATPKQAATIKQAVPPETIDFLNSIADSTKPQDIAIKDAVVGGAQQLGLLSDSDGLEPPPPPVQGPPAAGDFGDEGGRQAGVATLPESALTARGPSGIITDATTAGGGGGGTVSDLAAANQRIADYAKWRDFQRTATPEIKQIAQKGLDHLDAEAQMRATNVTPEQVRAARADQFARRNAAIADAEQHGASPAAQAIAGMDAMKGSLWDHVPAMDVSNADQNVLYKRILDAERQNVISGGEAATATSGLQSILEGGNIEPGQSALLRKILGGDIVDALDPSGSRVKIPVGSEGIGVTRPMDLGDTTPPVTKPILQAGPDGELIPSKPESVSPETRAAVAESAAANTAIPTNLPQQLLQATREASQAQRDLAELRTTSTDPLTNAPKTAADEIAIRNAEARVTSTQAVAERLRAQYNPAQRSFSDLSSNPDAPALTLANESVTMPLNKEVTPLSPDEQSRISDMVATQGALPVDLPQKIVDATQAVSQAQKDLAALRHTAIDPLTNAPTSPADAIALRDAQARVDTAEAAADRLRAQYNPAQRSFNDLTGNSAAPALQLDGQTPGTPASKAGWFGPKGTLDAVADSSRALLTLGHFGTALIQGFGTLITHPAAWFENTVAGVRALAEGEGGIDAFRNGAIKDANDLQYKLGDRLAAAGELNVLSGSSGLGETGDLASAGIERAPVVGGAFRASHAMYIRMTEGYRWAQAMDEAKAQIAKNISSGKGEWLTDDQVHSIADSANHITGTLSKSGLTGNPAIDWTLWSPKLLGSQIALVKDALTEGGAAGTAARAVVFRGLGSIAAATITTNVLMSLANGGPVDVWGPGLGHDVPTTAQGWDDLVHKTQFMKVRIGGHDYSAFGPFDSAGRYFIKGVADVASGNSGQLGTDLERFATGKMQPVARLALEAITHKDAIGNPFNTSSLGDWLNQIKESSIPIVAQQGYDTAKAAVAKDAGGAVANAVSMFGARQVPENVYEKRDSDVQAAGLKDDNGKPVTSWADMSPSQKVTWNAQHGKITGTIDNPYIDQYAKIKADAASNQAAIDAANPPGKAWRDAYHQLLYDTESRVAQLNSDLPQNFPANETAEGKALSAYDAVVAANTPYAGATNWNAVDAWSAANPTQANLVNNFFAVNAKANPNASSTVNQYHAASTQVGNAGYFNLSDQAWAEAQARVPALKGLDFNTQLQTWTKQALDYYKSQGLGDLQAQSMASKYVANMPSVKLHSELLKVDRQKWVIANPQAAKTAATWGYLTPTKPEQVLIDQATAADATATDTTTDQP